MATMVGGFGHDVLVLGLVAQAVCRRKELSSLAEARREKMGLVGGWLERICKVGWSGGGGRFRRELGWNQ